MLNDDTRADSIMNRVIKHSYEFELDGEIAAISLYATINVMNLCCTGFRFRPEFLPKVKQTGTDVQTKPEPVPGQKRTIVHSQRNSQ